MSNKLVSALGVTLLIFGAVAFFGLGGVESLSRFFNGFKLQSAFADSSIQSGSPNLETSVLSTSIVNKRNSLQGKSPPARTGIITDPTRGELALLTRVSSKGNISQFSDGSIGILSPAEQFRIREKGFSTQELQDIEALEARRKRFIDAGGNPNLKLSGKELVLRKREQEQLSKNFLTSKFGAGAFVDGKLFANPNFGAPSNDPRNLTKAEREEIERNKIINEQNRIRELELGKSAAQKISSSGQSQREFLRAKGFNVSGNLSERALGDLIRKGVIKV